MKSWLLALILLLGGCATVRESYPTRTATEQLLISDAIEAAAVHLVVSTPPNRKCFLDTTNFEGVDARYAISTIRQHLMQQGIALMEKREDADTIIEIRAGALSIDSKGVIVNFPNISVGQIIPIMPTPLTFSQWSRKVDEGIAKISAFTYDKKTGKLMSVSETVIGKSRRIRNGATQIFVQKLSGN